MISIYLMSAAMFVAVCVVALVAQLATHNYR